MEQDKRDFVIRLLARKIGRDPAHIADNARLLHDLGLDGDDATEVISEISKTFSVNVSGFDCSKYFRLEPSLLSLLWFLPSQKRERISSKRPLTVAELLGAVERGELS